MIPNGHFHKDWQRFVKTWFNQPARKFRRRAKRLQKANKVAPRPAAPLRPAVRCPTARYHGKVRQGKGFSLQEIKQALMSPAYARSIGIAVDPRRRNKSYESVQINVQRVNEYKARLIIFPRKENKKLRKGEATVEERKTAVQIPVPLMPIKASSTKVKAKSVSDEDKKFSAFAAIRKARADERLVGIRAKRMKEAAENPDDVAKVAKDKKPKKK